MWSSEKTVMNTQRKNNEDETFIQNTDIKIEADYAEKSKSANLIVDKN